MLFFHWNAVSLLDDGTFFAAFHDYKITDDDAFVGRPDSPAIPREVLYAQGGQAVGSIADAPPMVCVDGVLYRQSLQQIFYEEKRRNFAIWAPSKAISPTIRAPRTACQRNISRQTTLWWAQRSISTASISWWK